MVTWNSIMEELGAEDGFRAAVVKVFLKYKGQDTDERDKYRKVVKVTVASFARHLGIAQQTFDNWVSPPAPRTPREIVPVTGTISEVPEAPVVPIPNPREILNIPDRPHRPEPTVAERKAHEANAHAFVAPLVQAADNMVAAVAFPSAVGTLGELLDTLTLVVDNDYPVTDSDLKEAYELLGQVSQLLMKLELMAAKK